jgi:transposase-like protein
MPVTRTATVSTKCMSTRWKVEGFWSLLRSWLRPHRGISQEKLPIYLGFFEFVHNVRRRGRALLGSLLDTLLQPMVCPQNPI